MTFRFKLLSIAAALGLAAAVTTVAAREERGRIEWRIEDKAESPGQVSLQLTHRRDRSVSSYGRTLPLTDLQGLTAAQLNGPSAQLVRFRLARDAGAFDCEGSALKATGSGACSFEPGRAFAQRLAAAGMGEADDDQLFALALTDVGGAYLDELKRQRYATPTVEGLVRAAHHGVNLRYLKEMDAAGYRVADLEGLVNLRIHGVNARYVEGLKSAGYGNLSAEQITQLRIHGVSTRFVAELQQLGYDDLSAEELISLRIHGVSASFIRKANADGSRRAADELVKLRLHRGR